MASADQCKAKGNECFKVGDLEGAIQWYSKAVNQDPNNRVYYSNRAAAYTRAGQLNAAIQDGRNCIRCDPSWKKGYYRLATALQKQGDWAGAYDTAQKGLQKVPNDNDLLKLRAETEQRAKQQKADAESKLPRNARLKAQGNALFKEQKFEQAVAYYSQAIDHEETKAGEKLWIDCYNNRAACKQQLGNHQGIVEDCSMVLEHDEKNIKALMRRGLAFEALERFRSALADIRQVLLLRHVLPAATLNTANQAQHRLNQAVRQAKKMDKTRTK